MNINITNFTDVKHLFKECKNALNLFSLYFNTILKIVTTTN